MLDFRLAVVHLTTEQPTYTHKHNEIHIITVTTSGPAKLLGVADRRILAIAVISRRSVQKLWRIHLAMLICMDRGVKV